MAVEPVVIDHRAARAGCGPRPSTPPWPPGRRAAPGARTSSTPTTSSRPARSPRRWRPGPRGIPYVVTAHGQDVRNLARPPVRRATAGRAVRRRRGDRREPPPGRGACAPTGLDAAAGARRRHGRRPGALPPRRPGRRPRRGWGSLPTAPLVLAVGGLTERKNPLGAAAGVGPRQGRAPGRAARLRGRRTRWPGGRRGRRAPRPGRGRRARRGRPPRAGGRLGGGVRRAGAGEPRGAARHRRPRGAGRRPPGGRDHGGRGARRSCPTGRWARSSTRPTPETSRRGLLRLIDHPPRPRTAGAAAEGQGVDGQAARVARGSGGGGRTRLSARAMYPRSPMSTLAPTRPAALGRARLRRGGRGRPGRGLGSRWCGVGLAVLVLAVALIRDVPMRRLAPVAVVITALAAIAGPNLAAPGAGLPVRFRILIVLLGLGVVGYLLMDGRLVLPARPAAPGRASSASGCSGRRSRSAGPTTPAAAVRWTQLPGDDDRPGHRDRAALPRPAAGRRSCSGRAGAAPSPLACLVAMAEVATGLHLPSFRRRLENRGRPDRRGLALRQPEQLRHLPQPDACPTSRCCRSCSATCACACIGFVGGGGGPHVHPAAPGASRACSSAGFVVIGPAGAGRAPTAAAAGAWWWRAPSRCWPSLLVVPDPVGRRAGEARRADRHQARLQHPAQPDRDPARGPAACAAPSSSDGPRPRRRDRRPRRRGRQRREQVRALVNFPGGGQPAQLVARGARRRRDRRASPCTCAFFLTLLRGQARAARRTAGPPRALHGPGGRPVADRLDHRQRRPVHGDPLRARCGSCSASAWAPWSLARARRSGSSAS